MPALSFQSEFAVLVEQEKKHQTIRPYRKNGHDPKAESKKVIEGAQAKRKHDINQRAERKLAIERELFDNMTGHQQFNYMEPSHAPSWL